MKIKVEKINLVKDKKSKVKAFVSVTVNGVTINDGKIVNGENGLFVAMPTRSYEKDGETKYSNVVYIADETIYEAVTEAVLSEYQAVKSKAGKKKAIEKSYPDENYWEDD